LDHSLNQESKKQFIRKKMKQPETQTINLNNLIQQIQSEGIQAAEKKSDEIIRKTNEKASLIIAEAKKKRRLFSRKPKKKSEKES